MTQFGMQMPGGRARRTASMDVYTGLLFCAVLGLAVASGFMWQAATKVAPGGSAFTLHPEKIAQGQALKPGR